MKPRLGAWLLLAASAFGFLLPGRPRIPAAAAGPFSRRYLSSPQPAAEPSPAPRPVPGTPLPSPSPAPPPSLEGLRLEILNGSGAPKVALKLSVALDRRRIRTLRVDNADRWNYAKTLLKPAPGQEARARALASVLGLDPEGLREAPGSTDADIVLILGQDHDAVLKAASRRDGP